jgi:hypothetical protein
MDNKIITIEDLLNHKKKDYQMFGRRMLNELTKKQIEEKSKKEEQKE